VPGIVLKNNFGDGN